LKNLKEVEEDIQRIFYKNEVRIFSDDEFCSLKFLKEKKKALLDKREMGWRHKSIDIYLSKVDMKTKYFHRFAIHRWIITQFGKLVGQMVLR
jgi:hypothetical protein